jgi:hypothetical protein
MRHPGIDRVAGLLSVDAGCAMAVDPRLRLAADAATSRDAVAAWEDRT